MEKVLTAHDRYDKANTVRITLKLNINTDKDILNAIDPKNKQGSIKKLIRESLTKK